MTERHSRTSRIIAPPALRRLCSAFVIAACLTGGLAAPVAMAQTSAPDTTLPATSGGGRAPTSLLPAAPAAPAPATAAQPAASPASSHSPAAAPAASPSTGPPLLEVRGGEHPGYARIVFDWPRAVKYSADKTGDRAVITFAAEARVDPAEVRATLPPDVRFVSAETAGGKTTVTLGIPESAHLRLLKSGSRVVLDVMREAEAKTSAVQPPTPPAAAQAEQQPKPAAPPETPKPSTPAEPQKPPAAVTATEPMASPAEGTAAAPAATTPAATAPAPATPGAATPPPPPAVPGSAPTAAPAPTQQSYSLSVSWDQPVAAAVFQRAGYLWMVFDRHQDVDIKLLRRLGGDAVTFAEQLPIKSATALRLILQPDYKPNVRREGLLWVVDLTNEQSEPRVPIAIVAPASLPNGIGISLDVADPGNAVSITDPEVGDTMVVVPVLATGAGVYPGRDTPDVQILPTLQGIALVPKMDNLEVKTSRSGVTIGMTGKSDLLVSGPVAAPKAAAKAGGGLLDVVGWMRGGADRFAEESQIVEAGLANLAPGQASTAHLQAAQFYFANGYGAECLGYLRLAAAEEATIVDTAPFRALRGACSFLMGRWADAQADLDNPLVANDPEVQVWRAAAHAAAPDASPAAWNKTLGAGLPLLKTYPKALKWPITETAARAGLAAADDRTARDAISILNELASGDDEHSEIAYLSGALDELKGDFDRAVAEYGKAREGENREYRARAGLAQTELLLKLKKISPKEAADRLDHLRFAWRDDEFEFNLLRRLADLQAEAGNYPDALRTLRSLANDHPENKGTPEVIKTMHDLFGKLFLNGAADSLPPVSAIALYDEFRDLTPSGPEGDEMIRKLADRLVKVDLLDRAGALLKYQIGYRLQGIDKARVGAQLGLLDLLDKRPNDALDALSSSTVDNIPPDLAMQRRHIQARALAYMQKGADAIKLLDGDASQEGGLLRAEIYWREHDWPDAAAAFEALVNKPGRGATLDDPTAQLVLSWATALTLANDERGLAALQRNFGPAMAGTHYQGAFDLLTSSPDRQLANMPEMATKIKQAENFQTFLNTYKDKMLAGGLSSVN